MVLRAKLGAKECSLLFYSYRSVFESVIVCLYTGLFCLHLLMSGCEDIHEPLQLKQLNAKYELVPEKIILHNVTTVKDKLSRI